jgi:hypothetical protein
MGYGDELMGSGMAKGAKARGKRIAFGDGLAIIWHRFAHEIYAGNPNVAEPGDEKAPDLEWIAHYSGKRVYNRQQGSTGSQQAHWVWKEGFGDKPGEIYFMQGELDWADRALERIEFNSFVLLEPNVPLFKTVRTNKQWAVGRWQRVADQLMQQGIPVVQVTYGPPHGPGYKLTGIKRTIESPTFRHGIAVMRRAKLFLGPEGGMHHGAAAIGARAVVVFGGVVSPRVTGYSSQRNIYMASDKQFPLGCGRFNPCDHCQKALASITVDMVYNATIEEFKRGEETKGTAASVDEGRRQCQASDASQGEGRL